MPSDLEHTIPSAVSAEIRKRLAETRTQYAVAIPLAIESGSRAWGFPSPDSDFDCRFVFVRRLDHYLSPWLGRDVIDPPIDGDFDINGWELGKALKLMLKGNAVVLEWLQSPVAYEVDAAFRAEFLELARRHADRHSVGNHYLHLGERQWRTYFGEAKDEVPLKKVFYALRPAATLRWLELNPDKAVPPMNFVTLMAEIDPPSELAELVSDLLQRKAMTRELGQSTIPPPLVDFITGQYALARAWLNLTPRQASVAAKAEVDDFFRATVRRFDDAAGAPR